MEASPRYLRRDKAAAHVRDSWGLPCSTKWLAKLAVVGGGPIFRKAGRTPIYAPADLDAWAQARIGAPQKSTSDTKAVQSAPLPERALEAMNVCGDGR